MIKTTYNIDGLGGDKNKCKKFEKELDKFMEAHGLLQYTRTTKGVDVELTYLPELNFTHCTDG